MIDEGCDQHKRFMPHCEDCIAPKPSAPREFPIQSQRGARPHPTEIPWYIADLAYSVYSARYGRGQSLERLAERGGFGPGEMDDFLPDWREQCSAYEALEKELADAKSKATQWNVEANKRADEREALEKELKDLREFKKQWDEKDGNSPGYNCEKAKNYGNQASEWRAISDDRLCTIRMLEKELATLKTDMSREIAFLDAHRNHYKNLIKERDQARDDFKSALKADLEKVDMLTAERAKSAKLVEALEACTGGDMASGEGIYKAEIARKALAEYSKDSPIESKTKKSST